ncbi:MAG: Stress response kinase A [Chlamydiia bacterium]|nr:Stress response kinase A [Chlamydiia bacterium]MCH9615291.1 Stress response kinase A [Chlamydiia bacterium]MCH9628387.1 Stress response kinase A [Chlamydiia bacterium]
MLKKTPLLDQIIHCLDLNYGIRVSELTLLTLGADTNATLYQAKTIDTSYFLKIQRKEFHEVSLEVIDFLVSSGIERVIPPIKTVQGKTSQILNEETLTLYPFIEGQNGFNRSLSEDQWVKLGQALRQIHSLELPQSLYKRLRRETFSAKWRESVRSMKAHINADSPTDALSRSLQTFMQQKLPEIHRLVDRSEALAEGLKNAPLELVLCHSDIHGGNVLISHADLYIVDWDEPILAPKERDLMFIGGGVANVWNDPAEEELFYKGYGNVDMNLTALAYYRHERIVEDIAIYCQEILLGKGVDREEMYKHFIAMFEPNGVVDIAFKSDIL